MQRYFSDIPRGPTRIAALKLSSAPFARKLQGCLPETAGRGCQRHAPHPDLAAGRDQEAPVGSDGKALQQVDDHARPGLAPIAIATIARNNGPGMVGTVFESINMRADGGQLVRYPAMQRVHVTLFIEPAGDAGLAW